MKPFIKVLLLFILICGAFSLQAQTDFGIKGGLNFTFYNVEEANFGDDTNVQTGVYVGVFADFEIENDFHLQPELLYIGLGDFKFLNAPIYLKYNINDNFNILVGPSINYFFDFFNAKLKVRADLGFAYNLTSKLDLHMKYTIGFEEITPNGLFLGLGYKL
ncbi:outer membrane beta-barrel protein [Winogradskyella helgolandensis]|uniref:outer membrane beta-barrel protein n=1 Tax=Winogradskyella helgolandensis TaxID=2697010 RepID=UPI0015B8F177|nr:outer membrane beta-barrel protein [Winogradskyella helgolandensis]